MTEWNEHDRRKLDEMHLATTIMGHALATHEKRTDEAWAQALKIEEHQAQVLDGIASGLGGVRETVLRLAVATENVDKHLEEIKKNADEKKESFDTQKNLTRALQIIGILVGIMASILLGSEGIAKLTALLGAGG